MTRLKSDPVAILTLRGVRDCLIIFATVFVLPAFALGVFW